MAKSAIGIVGRPRRLGSESTEGINNAKKPKMVIAKIKALLYQFSSTMPFLILE